MQFAGISHISHSSHIPYIPHISHISNITCISYCFSTSCIILTSKPTSEQIIAPIHAMVRNSHTEC